MTGLVDGGVLLLDKPVGWTSNAALGRARRLLGGVKAGHTGTLDPFASGLLPVTVGEAGKFSRYLLDADKRYEAHLKLGFISSTGDPEGAITATGGSVPSSRTVLDQVLLGFMGDLDQIPPMHSALKQQGVPLYELARKGLEVPRAPRRICIHTLDVLAWSGGDELVIDVRCSKGTYIRVLAEDIGRALGCGAYLTELRRTEVGPMNISQAIELSDFEQLQPGERTLRLLPPATLLAALPRIEIDGKTARDLLSGKHPGFVGNATGELQAWAVEGIFIGVVRASGDGPTKRLAPVRMMSPSVLP
ncbi:MAG: tRNA pseudouridine(55) synthase TruB [Burkholderiales bacterium]|nr:tRNA pseudouridine(55) synthase TruB [Burkholderiales bacterium]